MSVLNWQVNSVSDFAPFFIFITHNSPVNFKHIHFLLWIKGLHKSPNFETFKCSGEILPNFSCHFLNHKLVFLQILHNYSLSWKITPLYFFRSNVIHFARKRPIKVQIFQIFECSDQNSSNSCHFWDNKLVFLQILHHYSVSWDITLLYIFSWNFTYFQQKEIWWHFTWAVKSLKFCTWMGSFYQNYIKFQLKRYTEKWWKVWRKTDLWFQIWHEEFCEFSSNHPKVHKCFFDWLFFVQSIWLLS